MISIRDLRKRPELFKKLLALKSDDSDVDQLLVLDEASRKLQTEVNHLRAKRNSASEAIGLAKKAEKDASDAIKQTRKLGDRLKEIESKFQKIDKKYHVVLLQRPLLHFYFVLFSLFSFFLLFLAVSLHSFCGNAFPFVGWVSSFTCYIGVITMK